MSYNSNNFKGNISEYKGVLHWKGFDYKEFLEDIETPLLSDPFLQGERKCLVDPTASCCMVNWGLTFSPLLNCYIQIWNVHAAVVFNYLETLPKTFVITARQNQFIQENIFSNAPIRLIAFAMTKNSAFTQSPSENPSWYQKCDLRQVEYSEVVSPS